MRDPRKNPIVGDVVTRFGTTRAVTAITTSERGTVTHVTYCHPSVSLPPQVTTISNWRNWAKFDAMIVRHGPVDAA